MAIIYNFIGFLMCEAPTKNRIDNATVKGVANDQIIFGLILNTSMLQARGIGLEILGLEIHQYISIPRVR